MIICKPEEANQYDCCVKEGKCKGKSCMAWADYFEIVQTPGQLGRGNIRIPETKSIATGKGYCGLVK